jgi:hypothetical protein
MMFGLFSDLSKAGLIRLETHPAKNNLTAADAKIVEKRFQAKPSTLSAPAFRGFIGPPE